MRFGRWGLPALAFAVALGACADGSPDPAADADRAAAGDTVLPSPGGLPPAGDDATDRLTASPRHGEWVDVGTGAGDSVRAWVVYPERADPAPVVLVVHEIYGLTDWVRSVADQLAADGFIAIAPDLLSGHGVPVTGTEPEPQAATAAVRALEPDEVHRRLTAVAGYGMGLPSALPSYGIVGYCWGGMVAFEHATRAPDLGAAVVYYGTSPDSARLASIAAPVLGLYGGDDERVNATVPAADSTMDRLGLIFEHETFPGAGHGFLRAQDGRDGANLAAARGAWPRTVEWLTRHLDDGSR